MKIRSLSIAALFLTALCSTAATLQVNNLVGGPGDTLYVNSANLPMTSGLVTMGYFPAGIVPTTAADLLANLGSYVMVTSAIPGTTPAFTDPAPGYANSSLIAAAGGLVPETDGLFGRRIYSIITNARSLSLATAANEYALVLIGQFKADSPLENEYFSNPGAVGVQLIVGKLASLDTATPAGTGRFTTLQMVAVPEPTSALMGLLGSLFFLKRRRI